MIEAFPEAKERVPALRMVVVAGPRIDPGDACRSTTGLEVRAYVHELYRHLAACDLAVVQGGLTTCMELTANRRPFLYFPLRHHFEQNFHVRHRLGRYGAGRCMDFETRRPDDDRRRDRRGDRARGRLPAGRDATAPRGPRRSSPSCSDSGCRAERAPPEQTRARYPDESGYVERDGVRVYYEVYGSGEPTVLLLPTWSIVHSRHWKMQIPYLARHCRVVTFDGRGNGRSDRPQGASALQRRASSRTMPSRCWTRRGTERARHRRPLARRDSGRMLLAAEHPERVEALVFIAPDVLGVARATPERSVYAFDAEHDTRRGLGQVQPPLLAARLSRFVEFFFARRSREPHSTKQIEDARRLGARDQRRDADRHGAAGR